MKKIGKKERVAASVAFLVATGYYCYQKPYALLALAVIAAIALLIRLYVRPKKENQKPTLGTSADPLFMSDPRQPDDKVLPRLSRME